MRFGLGGGVDERGWLRGRVWLGRGCTWRGLGCVVGATHAPRRLASGRYASCRNADLFTVSSDRHTTLTYQQNLRVDGYYGKVGSFSKLFAAH